MTSMVVLAFLVPLGLAVQHLARERALADAERLSATVVAVLAVTNDRSGLSRALNTMGDQAGTVAVHGLAGGTVGVSHALDDDVQRAATRGRPAVTTVAGGASYLEPVDVGGGRTAVVEVFVPESDLARGVRSAWSVLLAVAVILVGLSVLAHDRLAARVSDSARGLADTARAVGDGEFDARVTVRGLRELAAAGLAFNAMADRVSALLASEREMVADMSHRLRTPLTALRLEAESLDGDRTEFDPADTWRPTARLRQAVDVLEQEVDSLIRAARTPVAGVSGAAQPEVQRCNASAVVLERMAFWAAVAEDQGRPYQLIGVHAPAPVPVPASELAAALDALLGNVFRYTPQGAAFEVAVSRRDGYVAVRVDDAGSGIPDPDRALRRGESDQGSTGLGLSIVHGVAEAGRGSVSVDRAALGGASVVMLLVDADAPEPPAVSRFGFVGRLARDPTDHGWRRHRLRRGSAP